MLDSLVVARRVALATIAISHPEVARMVKRACFAVALPQVEHSALVIVFIGFALVALALALAAFTLAL